MGTQQKVVRPEQLYLRGLSYVRNHCTQGLVHRTALEHLGGTQAAAELLECLGWWTKDPLGWRVNARP